MGKKVKRKTYVSKGERNSVARSTVKAVKRDLSPIDKAMNTIKAWRAGKNPWVTVAGPSSNMRFIKVRANAVYGDPRFISSNVFKD